MPLTLHMRTRVCVYVCVLVAQSCLILCNPWAVACQAPLSLRFSRREYWGGLPCAPLGDLPNPRVELTSPASPALQADSLLQSHLGSAYLVHCRGLTSVGFYHCYSVQFSRSVVSDSLRPHELQHARPPCPSPTPGVHSNSRPSSR